MAVDSSKGAYIIYPSIFLLLFLSCLNSYFHFLPFPITPTTITPVPPAQASESLNTIGNHTTPPPLPAPVTELLNITANHNVKRRSSGVERVEERLAAARAAIRKAARTRRYMMSSKKISFVPRGPLYRNPYAFHQSHIEMEKMLKVWSYKEGEKPMFHNGPLKDIYSIEGQFMDELENGKSRFLAKTPDEALLFFLPVSIVEILHYLYRPHLDYDRGRLQKVVADYIGVLSTKYPYWSRSNGADHFFVSCHDWAPEVSAVNPKLYKNFIRVLCNANSSEGFHPARDVSLPEIKISYENLGPPIQGEPPTKRWILAFFAGGAHGHVRKSLFQHWKDKKDDQIQVHEYLPKNMSYFDLMGKTKFCLCPSGYEVASPRVVEAISSGCVPVIISDNYVLPFSDVLDWSKFSIHIPVGKIPDIRKILEGVSMEEYLKKQKLVMEVQRHFRLHRPSQPFDMMDMVFHSIWLRRLNVRLV